MNDLNEYQDWHNIIDVLLCYCMIFSRSSKKIYPVNMILILYILLVFQNRLFSVTQCLTDVYNWCVLLTCWKGMIFTKSIWLTWVNIKICLTLLMSGYIVLWYFWKFQKKYTLNMISILYVMLVFYHFHEEHLHTV